MADQFDEMADSSVERTQMNLKSLSLQAIDKLLEYWQTDTAKSVAESREESAAVVDAVYAPVIADLEQLILFYSGEGEPEGPEIVEWRDLARIDAAKRTPEQAARIHFLGAEIPRLYDVNLLRADNAELHLLWKSEQQQGFYHFNRANDLGRRLGLARDALAGAIVVMESLFSDQGRDPSNNDNYCRVVDALAQLGAPAPVGDDEPRPEFIRGYLKAADDLAEPYPDDVSFFAPLTKEQIEQAVAAMGGDISGRLHAHWARHWADVLRKRSAEIAPSLVEGSWDWALAQMKAGGRVRRPAWTPEYNLAFDRTGCASMFGINPDFDGTDKWDRWVPRCRWYFSRDDLEATDWRIADGEKP